LKLFIPAADIIRKSKDEEIRSTNQRETTVHTSCSTCNTPLENGWSCKKCKKIVAQCSFCNQKVKGLYVWCQICGHGGHSNHISDWFSVEETCPSTGCGHRCLLQKHQQQQQIQN